MRLFASKKLDDIELKINEKSKVGRYLAFILGCLIMSISFNLFLAPNDLVPGGVSGAAIILNDLFGINTSTFILIVNITLLIVSYFLLGKEKTKASILGSLLFPLFIELTSDINLFFQIDNSQVLLSALFAGVISGFGAGINYKAGFTTGGTDILNQIISKYFKLGMGKSMLICDGTIVVLSGIVFGVNNLMYSIIILYIISYMSDKVILGISNSKAFYIVTDEDKKIKEYILKYLNHGVTEFNAKGGLYKEKKHVLMCVLPTREYYMLKEGINEIDPDAFFVVCDAYEVFGGE